MTNIDWRAFWTSFATIIVVLVIYGIVIEPILKKYKIQVVKDPINDLNDKLDALIKKGSTSTTTS